MRTDILQVPFLDLTAQHRPIRSEIDAAIAKIIDTNAFILGGPVDRFEAEFADYCNARRCVGAGSGTAAISLLLRAHGVGPGDEVITPPNTFIATVEAIAAVGATPVLADVDPDSWLLDPVAVESRITARTRAILAVHLYGHVADLGALRALADRHGILLLEDAAQAHGARWQGQRIGHGSQGAAFSFYPGKNLGALGDGGAVVVDDESVADTIVALRHHGQSGKNLHTYVGGTDRLDGIQAAVLSVKLAYLDGWNAARRQHAARYREFLADSRFSIPVSLEGTEPVHHLFVINHPEVHRVKMALSENGIGWGEHYPRAVHLQPAFSHLGLEGEFPVAEAICANIVSLPMFAELPSELIDRTCDVLLRVDS